MEDDSEHPIWDNIKRIFGHKESPIEDVIAEANEDGELKKEEMSMLLNVLQLSHKQAKEIMIPRTDMVCADENNSLKELTEIMIESGHSRIPIYKENKDNIIGIIHSKDLLKVILHCSQNDTHLNQIMRQAFFVPDTKNVKNILLDFQASKIHLAIVLDEYGGTSGLVTLEDVLEEIVGEIEDEYDQPKTAEIQFREDKTILVSGRTLLEDLEEECNIALHSDQVETIGGFICEIAGRVPQPGEKFTTEKYIIQIEKADAKHIESILISTIEK